MRPGLGSVTSNNVATRLARHRHTGQGSASSRERIPVVAAVLPKQQQNAFGRSLIAPGAAAIDDSLAKQLEQWSQAGLTGAELQVSTHPAGGDAAAAYAASSGSGSGAPTHHQHDNDLLLQSQQHDHDSHYHHHSSGSSGSSPALPEELLCLADASAPVSLPPPASVPPGSLDNRELDKLVGTLGRNKATWRRALVLSQWLQESGHVLDDRLCTTLIRVCSEHGQAVTALSVYEWMKAPAAVGGAGLRPTVYTFTAAMRAALAAGLLERALGVWEDAQAAQCQMDCRLCITYIEVCSRKGLTEQALAMYTAMKNAPRGSKLSPTVHAYTAAMRAATEGGMWAKALSIWHDMELAGVTPTGHAFAAAMSACAAGSNWQQAVSLFEDMCKAGIKPDVVSCTALISALAAAGQWQRSESVVQWMLSTGVRPNVRTFTALLTALGNARQWDRAFEMLGLMQHSSWGGVSPNAYTYSALLKCLGECGEWQRAEKLFALLEQQALQQGAAGSSRRQGLPPTAATAAAAGAAAALQQSSAASAAATAAAVAAATAAAAASHLGDSSTQQQHQQFQQQQGHMQPDLGHITGQMGGPLSLSGLPGHSAAASNSSSRHSSSNELSSAAGAGSASAGSLTQREAAAGPGTGVGSEEQGLWTSASQLHGLNLNLQLEAVASQSGNSGSGSGSDSSLGVSRTGSPEPEVIAASSSQLQGQAAGPTGVMSDDAVAAAAAAAGVSSSTVAQQLAQLALQQQIAAGMDLQLLMHQQQLQALAATQRLQQQQQQQVRQAYGGPTAGGGPLRTQQMQHMRQQQQQQQHQHQHQQQQQQQHGFEGGRHASSHSGSPGLINVYVVSSLMQAYERAGKWQMCVGALARGAALGVAPTAAMYASAISAAGKAGQLGVADALFTQARAAGAADNTTYETMVAVLGMAGDPARAEVVLRAMQAAGFRPGDYAYCGLVTGYSLINDHAAAQRVRTRIVREQGPGSVSVHVYNALLAAADRAGSYERALELLRCMRREGIEANGLTQQLAADVGRKGAVEVEGQQLTAAALSAAMAAAGTLLMQRGVW